MVSNEQLKLICVVNSISFQTFFVQAFEIVVDSYEMTDQFL